MFRREPIRPDASCPCVCVERGDSEDAPLLSLPRRIEPEWLREKTKDARPPSPAFTLVLREPDGDDAGYENGELIQDH